MDAAGINVCNRWHFYNYKLNGWKVLGSQSSSSSINHVNATSIFPQFSVSASAHALHNLIRSSTFCFSTASVVLLSFCIFPSFPPVSRCGSLSTCISKLANKYTCNVLYQHLTIQPTSLFISAIHHLRNTPACNSSSPCSPSNITIFAIRHLDTQVLLACFRPHASDAVLSWLSQLQPRSLYLQSIMWYSSIYIFCFIILPHSAGLDPIQFYIQCSASCIKHIII